MLVNTAHAALEHRPQIFNRVGVGIALDVFIAGMVDRVVGRKLFAKLGVDTAFIGMQVGRARYVGNNDFTNLIGSGAMNYGMCGPCRRVRQGQGWRISVRRPAFHPL